MTITFTAAVAFVLYVLIGYPLLLAAFARRLAKPIDKQLKPVPVSIVIPVRNGAPWIEAKLRSLLDSDYPRSLIEVVIVSDGSTDDTNRMVQNFADDRVRLLALPSGGKARAVSHGVLHATGEILILTDVRQMFAHDAISKLVACFADPSVGVVTGELIIRQGISLEEFNTGLYWTYEKWIRRNLNFLNSMLGASGCIYAVRREFAVEIPPEILLDDVYVPFAAAERGARIYFESGAKAYDLPTSLKSEFWRKMRTQAGVYQILFHFPSLLWPGNRRCIHFLSLKLGRLLLPFALVLVAASSVGLPQPWRTVFLACQLAFYLLAALDGFIPEELSIKKVSAASRTFVVLVAAAACALTVFVFPAQRLWKETQVGVPRESSIGGA